MNTGPQAALLKGVEAVIRAFLADAPADGRTPGAAVGLTDPDGKPPPGGWSVFYGIAGGAVQGKSQYLGRAEKVYGCRVTITMRLQGIPEDRIGYELLAKERQGLHDRVDALADLIHGSYADVLAAANAALDVGDGANQQGFHRGLHFADATAPVKKGARWFGAAEKGDKAQGYAVTATFAGANYQRGLEG